MSGIVGIFHRDGREVESSDLGRMTQTLAYRGPDGQKTWSEGQVGLGYAELKTWGSARKGPSQPQPMSDLVGVADAHLVAKAELIETLGRAGRNASAWDTDASLILHAYAVWGPRCVEHLSGDFAFAIWNRTARSLFCVRDHFGIKPFYYAERGDLFLFSNTLNCLRQHATISDQLDEVAIGDFLLFGLNLGQASTSFRDIQRLPPGCSLLVSRPSVKMTRYWRPPTEERIHFDRKADYVERFDELLTNAVAERLPGDAAGILLSGGLDSGAVAAVGQEISRSRGGKPELRSYTVGYANQARDLEGLRGAALAKSLGIPNEYTSFENLQLFAHATDPAYRMPEPVDDALSAAVFEQFRVIASDCRVALSGEGADNLMYFQFGPYAKELKRAGKFAQLTREAAWFAWLRPAPWRGIARQTRAALGFKSQADGLPQWIAPDFAQRTGLAERWGRGRQMEILEPRHQARPKAHASLSLPEWVHMFELQNPGVTRATVEVRYPFLDLRLVAYLLAIPAFPWTYQKRLLRLAMKSRLAQETLERGKTPLATDPIRRKLLSLPRNSPVWPERPWSPQIFRFVDPSRIPTIRGTMALEDLRPFYLDLWLQGIR